MRQLWPKMTFLSIQQPKESMRERISMDLEKLEHSFGRKIPVCHRGHFEKQIEQILMVFK